MKDVKGIGFTIPTDNDLDYINLDSYSSLGDTEIAVFAPDFEHTVYSTYNNITGKNQQFEGKMLYNKESSAKINEHCIHWKKELNHFLEAGGTLFIILIKKDDFYIYTGTKDVTGSGKNQSSTDHVKLFSNYSLLPFQGIDYHASTGKTIIPQSPIVYNILNQFKDFFSFEVYLKSEKITQNLFSTKNNDRVLGATLKVKNGNVIFLPNITFEGKKFLSEDENSDVYWNTEGIRLGKIFINNLIEIDKSLKNNNVQKSPKPDWLRETLFDLQTSLSTKIKIEKVEKDLEQKNKKLANLKETFEEQESLKDLLFETGKPLEQAVIKALKIMGYSAENYDDGTLELDQIILSPDGNRLIGECEGKDNRDIDVSKFRQLLDGLSADFEKENVIEKANGLIFGNPQRLINPQERTLDFTLKCKIGAKREKIGLIKTVDLFNVCKMILENNNDQEYAKICRKAIMDQLGGVIIFPNYTSLN